MKLKNYLKDLCQEDLSKHQNIRIGNAQKHISLIFQDIKNRKGYNYVKFISNTLKVDRRTTRYWRLGISPIPLPFLFDLLDIWRNVCNKNENDVKSKLDECFYETSYFSVMFGKRVNLPKVMTPELAYLLGNLFGDGCLTDYRKRIATRGFPEYPIAFASNTDKFLKEVILPYFKELFGINLKIYKQGNNCFVGKTSSKSVYFFLNKICGMPLGKKKGKLIIPEIIIGASSEIKTNFIAGFFDADGCIYVKNKHVSIVQADRRILESISYLIKSLGLSTRKIYTTKKELGTTYDLSINWKSVKEFLEIIPFKDSKRIENKEMILANSSSKIK